MRGGEWLADRLTRGYARLLDSDGVVDETVYRARGEAHRVYWVDAARWPIGGQYTPFGTLVLNANRLDGLSPESVDYVFLHEVGHGQRPLVGTVAAYVVRIVVTLSALLGVPWLGRRWFRAVSTTSSPAAAVEASKRFSVGGLVLLTGLVVVSWVDEGAAELFAVSKLGAESYRPRREEFVDGADDGVVVRSLRRLLYPPPRLVIAVADRSDGKRGQ